MSQTRDQIISFLLQSDDNKERIIADLQKQIAQLTQDIEAMTKPSSQAGNNPSINASN